MSIVSVLLCVVFLLIVPYLVGNAIAEFFKLEKSHSRLFLYGNMTIWAFSELISVPLVLLKQSFMVYVVLLSIFMAVLAIFGAIKKNLPIDKHDKKDAAILAVFFIASIAFLTYNFMYQWCDNDDSRFIVAAVDVLRTNRMFLTDLITGDPINDFVGELLKDVTAPWMVYCAYLAKMTGTSVVIMMHSCLKVQLMLLGLCTWWEFSGKILGKNTLHQALFVIILMVMIQFHKYSYHHIAAYYLEKIWEGKKVVGSTGIPAMFMFMADYYDTKQWIHILILNIGLCFLSGMGVVIGGVIIACYALGYAIIKKDIKVLFQLGFLAIPNVIIEIIHLIIC